MLKILQIIGTPSDDDKSFISGKKAIEYVTKLPVFKKLDYQSRFPFASKEAIDLLDKLLAFKPFFRISVDEALRHEFFKDVHDPSLEVGSSEEIDLEFDHLEVAETINRQKIRELMLLEIKEIKKMISEEKKA